MKADQLIDQVLSGDSAAEVVEQYLDEIRTRGTARRPRVQRFKNRGPAVNPVTGKRKDPKRRMLMRRLARKNRAKRSMAARKFARTSAGKQLHKRIGAGKLRH